CALRFQDKGFIKESEHTGNTVGEDNGLPKTKIRYIQSTGYGKDTAGKDIHPSYISRYPAESDGGSGARPRQQKGQGHCRLTKVKSTEAVPV
uniref:Uncharacterized protein n=1 Tax=Paramormyrops kingsleyae TaxID=1676925 RepID=A0A3B3TD67_9TELE